jgi:hypothetical protein
MNAQRHPNVTAITGTSKGVTIAPTLDPALKMPMAKARSRRGNHSLVAVSAAGNVPASPSASGMRAINMPVVVVKQACSTWPKVHSPTARA